MDFSHAWSEERSSKKMRLEETADSPIAPSDTYDDDLYDDEYEGQDDIQAQTATQPIAGDDMASPSSSKSLPGSDLLQSVPPRNDKDHQPAMKSQDENAMSARGKTMKEAEQISERKKFTSNADLAKNEPVSVQETFIEQHTAMIVAPQQQEMEAREFLDATEANKGDHEAEWQYDSSDAEHDDGSSSDSSDESESGDYELLGPEEQARILMAEEGGSDDEGGRSTKAGAHAQPRTANEQIEIRVEKPNVIVTPDMEILELGLAHCIVENSLLIRGTTSGETQVLESGSVICLPDRTVIGAVYETFGRVDAPLYSIAFTNAAEAAASGVVIGERVYYIKDHSSYVFTKPLRLIKGSDASNLHDEEVGEHELEFSDDEVETEYKRQKKQDKLAKKGVTSRSEFIQARGRYGPATDYASQTVAYPSAPIQYDDDDNDGLYTPLVRPTETHNEGTPLRPMQQHRSDPRGSIRGRLDRGRANRFRGRGRGQGIDSHQSRSNRIHDRSGPVETEVQSQPSSFDPYSPFAPSPLASSHGQSAYWNTASSAIRHAPPPSALPPGSFINPAFFRNQNPTFAQTQMRSTAQPSAEAYSPEYPQLDWSAVQCQYPRTQDRG